MGSGGIGGAKAACAQDLPPFGFARIIDIADPAKPTLVSQLKLEVDDPANCAAVAPDTSFSGTFGYSSHYCTVDNPAEARFAACSYFEAGSSLRYQDQLGLARLPTTSRRPCRIDSGIEPRNRPGEAPGGPPEHPLAAARRRRQWFTSQDNRFQIVRFTNSLATIGKTMAGSDPVGISAEPHPPGHSSSRQ
jgi:hypothetical protein